MKRSGEAFMKLFMVSISLIVFISCTFAQPAKRENYDTAYPPDFKTAKSNILVMTYDKESEEPDNENKRCLRSYSKDLQELFPKYYTGGYDIILQGKDINYNGNKFTKQGSAFKITNSNYADPDKYRYLLFCRCLPAVDIGNTAVTSFLLCMFDRKTGKNYVTSWHTGSNKPLMRYYLTRLEEVRPK